MKKIIVCILLITVLVGGAYAAPILTTNSGHNTHGFGHGALLSLFFDLDITDAQKTNIANVLKKHRSETMRTRLELRTALENLHKAMEADLTDESALRQAFKKVATVGEEVFVHKTQVLKELKTTLTQEQLNLLEEHKGPMVEHVKERFDKRFALMDKWIDKHSQ